MERDGGDEPSGFGLVVVIKKNDQGKGFCSNCYLFFKSMVSLNSHFEKNSYPISKSPQKLDPEKVDDYVRYMAMPRVWGTYVAIQAAARHYKVTVDVRNDIGTGGGSGLVKKEKWRVLTGGGMEVTAATLDDYGVPVSFFL